MDHDHTDGEHRPPGLRWDFDLAGGSPSVIIDVTTDGHTVQVEFDPQVYAALSDQQHAWATQAAAWARMYDKLIRLGMDEAVVANLVFSEVDPLTMPARALRSLRVPRA